MDIRLFTRKRIFYVPSSHSLRKAKMGMEERGRSAPLTEPLQIDSLISISCRYHKWNRWSFFRKSYESSVKWQLVEVEKSDIHNFIFDFATALCENDTAIQQTFQKKIKKKPSELVSFSKVLWREVKSEFSYGV